MDVVRIEKLKKFAELGINPYPYRFERTHSSREVIDNLDRLSTEKIQLKVAGRLVARREHGKTVFGHIEDGAGRIQIYLRQDFLGDRFSLLELLDIGDFLGITGEAFRTRTGEPTILVQSFELLAKSLKPLPEKWHGLKDTELRFRHRYLDLIANPEVKRIFTQRTKIVNLIRQFLNDRGFLEFETPILQPLYGGASARPFETHYNALDQKVFLRIADELYLKRLIVGGWEKVYEIAKDFRNEGLDRFHNPEFTQVELYEAYKDYNDMMHLVEELFRYLSSALTGSPQITYQAKTIDFSKPWQRISFVDALIEKTGSPELLESTEKELAGVARRFGIEVVPETPKAKLLDKLFSELIQKNLVEPTFVIDHPKILSPLAKSHRQYPERVERFEPVVCGIELGNAFSELNDPLDQRKRFQEQVAAREEFAVIDEDFLGALEHGMPPCGGLGMGIDRLVMLFTDTDSIREVILFPQLKPEPPHV
jgi:lysyl-tRNA synthetase class 2